MSVCAYNDCKKELEPGQEKYCCQDHQRLDNLTARRLAKPKTMGTGKSLKAPKPRKL